MWGEGVHSSRFLQTDVTDGAFSHCTTISREWSSMTCYQQADSLPLFRDGEKILLPFPRSLAKEARAIGVIKYAHAALSQAYSMSQRGTEEELATYATNP